MKNPAPRIQMIEGFNEGWIEFEGSVKGQTSLKTVLEEMVRDARKQAA
jgi:NAD(P)H dehydrogenase (quinone)